MKPPERERFVPGDQVDIVDGPYAGYSAPVEADAGGRVVAVRLVVFKRPLAVEIDARLLRLGEPSPARAAMTD